MYFTTYAFAIREEFFGLGTKSRETTILIVLSWRFHMNGFIALEVTFKIKHSQGDP